MVREIKLDSMQEFENKIELAKEQFLPMLPFVERGVHNFDKYKKYNEQCCYLIDDMGDNYCLYIFYKDESKNGLRAISILPSSFNKRFDILRQSMANVVNWFKNEMNYKQILIQSLEYGEIEYYPTLSHYIIGPVLANGFEAKYRMYMKKSVEEKLNEFQLKDNMKLIKYSEDVHEEIIKFYQIHQENNDQYFVNYSAQEFKEDMKDQLIFNNSRFIKNGEGQIIASAIVYKDSDRIWIDNLLVDSKYTHEEIGEYLISNILNLLKKTSPEKEIYVYLSRECKEAINIFKKNGFVPIEFWVDMIFEK